MPANRESPKTPWAEAEATRAKAENSGADWTKQ
jgi:hypothetical protein